MNRILLSVFFLVSIVPAAFAAPAQSNPRVIPASRHDVSPALQDIMRGVPPELGPGTQQEMEMEEPPFRQIAPAFDPVVQSSPGSPQQAGIVLSFDAITNGGAVPPDTNGAPGLTQYLQVVNWKYAVFDKATGQVTFGPYSVTTIFKGFGGACEFNQVGDPTVRFDRMAGRWVIQQIAGTGGTYLICAAVSTTSDATGAYARYAFSYGTKLPDYPKLAVWPDAYYVNADIYGNGFEGTSSCALDRNSMLQGLSAAAICFKTGSNVFQLLPADLDGPIPPPTGAPNYQVGNASASNNTLQLYKFHVDFANPQNSTYTGPFPISVAGYTVPCWSACVPQLGTSNRLDALGGFMMYRLAYRNFIPVTVPKTAAQAAHETLVAEHSVQGNGTPIVTRWYEFRAPENGNFTVYQQGTFAPDSYWRWMGSIGMDKKGDIALGYSLSDATLYPSIYFTGRVPEDPLGTMEQEVSIIAGANYQSTNRWGDYSSMVPDPVDDCTLWYTTEYLQSGSQSWKTRVAALKFSSCK